MFPLKYHLAFVCLGLALSTCFAADSNSTSFSSSQDHIKKATAEWRQHNRILTSKVSIHRGLDYAQCLADSNRIHGGSPALQLASGKILKEFDAAITACNSTSCYLDLTTLPSASQLEKACLGAGGNIFLFNQNSKCTFSRTDTGETSVSNIQYVNWQVCVATSSCTRADVAAAFELNFNKELDDVEAQLSVPGILDVTCDSNVVKTPGSAAFRTKIPSFIIAAVLGSVMFIVGGLYSY